MPAAGWAARLPQPAPVQTPVLNRLPHVLRRELGRAAQVRDRARDLENPVIRPRREREPGDRGTEQRVGALRHAAERPDVACRHVCVRIDPGPAGESLPLRHTRAIHPLPHRRARLTSPGRGYEPPPISPASEIVWCGARNGRRATSDSPSGSTPATEWIFVVSSASSRLIFGRMVGSRRASIVFPDPGGPGYRYW